MRIQLIPRIGGKPLVLDVSQFIVLNEMGTPVSVGAVYGPDGTIAVSCVGCDDFQRMLRSLGVQGTVVVDKLVMPKPEPGVKLLAGPK
jgi:hypothetical protein